MRQKHCYFTELLLYQLLFWFSIAIGETFLRPTRSSAGPNIKRIICLSGFRNISSSHDHKSRDAITSTLYL